MIRQLVVVLMLTISAGPVLADALPPPKKDGAKNAGAESVEPWWSETDAGWIGGGVGGTVGLLGAAFGITAGLGRARRFLLHATLALALLGVAILLVGLVAYAVGQPYHVYYVPQLIGGVMAFVFGFNYPIIKRRNEQMEMQQMAAMDT